ncbi:hypothetical protein K1719_029781 [Acacia pycnantha]|nr:hypothetical protein K1719_029781 [Acacia pycnantha]
MANQAASLPTARDSASASVTNKLSPVAAGKRKAMKQRSKMWDHFTKFVNDAGEIKGKCNYCGSVLDCDPKSNGIIALNNYFVNVCKQKPLPEELKQSHLNFNVEDDKFSLVNWKFDQDAHAYYGFGPLSCCLSVNYLDRFLSTYELPVRSNI